MKAQSVSTGTTDFVVRVNEKLWVGFGLFENCNSVFDTHDAVCRLTEHCCLARCQVVWDQSFGKLPATTPTTTTRINIMISHREHTQRLQGDHQLWLVRFGNQRLKTICQWQLMLCRTKSHSRSNDAPHHHLSNWLAFPWVPLSCSNSLKHACQKPRVTKFTKNFIDLGNMMSN